MNRNHSFFPKTLPIATFILLFTSFVLNAQRRLTDFYSTDYTTEFPTNFIEFNGKVYFMAMDATHGRNLWTSDGTKTGSRFFLETEPNRPETNQTSYFKTDSILYVFSQQNLWQIDKKQSVKQLNSQSLITTFSHYLVEFDGKLFFNSIEYFDLKSKSFQKISLNNIKPLTDDNLRYFNECSHNKIRALNFYENLSRKANSFYVLEPKQTVYTELSLGSVFSSVPSRIYKLKGNYFGLVNPQGIYKFTPDKEPERIGGYFQSVLYQNQVGEKLYFLVTQGSQITQYVFDGEKVEQVSNKLYDWAGISNLTPITNDSLFYSSIRLNTGENKLHLVRLNKAGELEIKFTISDGSNIGPIVKIMNDSLMSFAHQLEVNNSFRKTAIVDYKNFTIKFIELSGELALLPNGEFIGQKLKEPAKASSSSVFNLNKNEFLLGLFPVKIKSRPKSLGLAADILNKTLFVGLNEYDNVKSIYAFKPDNEQGKRILAQQDSSFNFRTYTDFNRGTVIADDVSIYASDAGENLSRIYDYTIDYSQKNNNYDFPKTYVYDHLKNTVVQIKNSNKTKYVLQNRTFEVDNDRIREIDDIYRTTLNTYYFPTKFRGDINRVVQINNMIYFWGAEGGAFEDQLFVFDGIDNLFKRIVDVPVYYVYSFKNRTLVLLKTGQLRLLDTKKAFENYYVMDTEFKDGQNYDLRIMGNFFVVFSQKKAYYSDGDCQNSGLVDVPERDVSWGVGRIQNTDYYILNNQSERFICNGRKNIKPFPALYSGIIGTSNKNVYYGNAIEDRGQGIVYKTLIYQYNLANSTTTLIDTINAYFPYYTNAFRVLEKGKKWEFTIGNKQYTITDISRNADKIEISTLASYAYIGSVYSGNNNTLFVANKELILRNNAQNTTLVTLKSNEYWYSNYNSRYYQQSEEYIYLMVASTGNLVKKIIRVSLKDFTLKTIDVPFGVKPVRTSLDGATYYPIILVSERLYAIIESPDEGQQLWLLDEAKQTQKVPVYTAAPIDDSFMGNKECAIARLNQLIPTEKVEQYGIFPNPTSKYLFLNIPKDQRQSIEQIEIYDNIGRLISNQITQNTFQANPDLISLNLPNLGIGVYFLRVNVSSTVLNFKFVIE